MTIKKTASKIQEFWQVRFHRVVTCVFLLVLVLNWLAVPVADDFRYAISNGLIDIFRREYVQYMTWTGRSVAHILARSFLAMPKAVFNICNSLCFIYLIWMLYCHATGSRKKDKPLLYALMALLVFLFAPLFGQTCLWETGSCNYLWTTAIVLTFLLPYRLQLEENPPEKKKSCWIWFFLFGIIAGWTNENTGGALILMILLVLLQLYRNHRKVGAWMYSGLLGSILGFVILILAPGNKVRAQDFPSTNGKVYDLVHDANDALHVLDKTPGMQVIFFLWIILLALVWILCRNRKHITWSVCYALCGVAAVLAIILSPVQVLFDRSMMGATMFVLIAIGLCLNDILSFQPVWRKAGKIFFSVLALAGIFQYGHALIDLTYTRYQYRNREAYVAEQKAAGNLNPVVPQIYGEFETTSNPMYGLADISPYPKLWVNEDYAQIHGLEGVQSTPLKKWSLIYKNGDPYLMNIQDLSAYIDAVKANSQYAVLINCSKLGSQYDAYTMLLEKFGIKVETGTYFVACYENGSLSMVEYSTSGDEAYGTLSGHSYYVTSYEEGSLSDILVDNTEYTNDNSGITFVVFDKSKDRVVDSVTWNTDNGMTGIRYQIEK